ncbi:unnamed protein product, partial [Soboliphyme baturini]|uniref:ANF_receptor domain-containing protein n=1 Tax=Soboliphyme baturini TaxID=241478 RepID=A0A183J4D6_9BILA
MSGNVRKSIYSSFLRTVPPWTEEADVWLDLLLYFDFRQVVLVFPDEQNSLLCIGRFLEQAAISGIQVQKYVKYEENLQSATSVVKEIETSNCNIIIMLASFYINTKLYDEESGTMLAFDSAGNKIRSTYHIVNTKAVAYVEGAGSDVVLQVSTTDVGRFYYSVTSDTMKIEITKDIIWFEGSTTRPTAFTLSSHLK